MRRLLTIALAVAALGAVAVACDDDVVTPEPSDRFVLDRGPDDADVDGAAALRVVCVCPPPVHCLPCPVCPEPPLPWVYSTPSGFMCIRCPDAARDVCASNDEAPLDCP